MLTSLAKFRDRFCLPPHLNFKLKSYVVNENKDLLYHFNKCRTKNKPIMELYYSDRKGPVVLHDIMSYGFKIINWYGDNRTMGIELANSPRSSIWARTAATTAISDRHESSIHSHYAIICHVIADEFYVKRYESEISSRQFNSVFVVANPKLIYPKYLVNFDIEESPNAKLDDKWTDFAYVKKEQLNCNNRICAGQCYCVCEQQPLVLEEDVVDIDY